MPELISIIVPIYNTSEHDLKRCVNSLISQTYKNTEIILVDDGSNISTAKIIDSYKNISNVIIVHKRNGGLSSARNAGVKIATGKWITFVDADDYLDLNILKDIFNHGKMLDEDIVCFGTIKEYRNCSFKYDYKGIVPDNKIINDGRNLVKLLLRYESNIGDVTSKIYRKKIIDEYSIEHDEKVREGVEAIDFNIRLFEKAKSLILIKKYGYYYSYNEQSITYKYDDAYIENLLYGIDKLYIDIKNNYDDKIGEQLDSRVKIVVVTTVISGITATDTISIAEKRRKINRILQNDNVKKALLNKSANIDLKRKMILFLIKCRMVRALNVMSSIRKAQKRKKK